MKTVKLIIWDLDETFWKGTLSDSTMEPIDRNINLIKQFVNRGIMNSICSKNDFESVKSTMENLHIWDYFVFPSVDWTPKGERIKNIIQKMNLRPENVLFIDDSANNLQEAKFACNDINVIFPSELERILEDESLKGKDDHEHSRLKQYKILEKMSVEKELIGSNDEFLLQSDIHVEMIEKCDDLIERIHEMIHRNNQLNFTKDRISIEETKKLFLASNVRSGCVHVYDKYGDHGIVGCYAVECGQAKQFVFSCRILGMGVEQYVYAKLGFPKIIVVGEVASELKKNVIPNWINQSKSLSNFNTINNNKKSKALKYSNPKMILYGACDLRPIWSYLQSSIPNIMFVDLTDSPSVCNLGVGVREAKGKLRDWEKIVDVFESNATFNDDIIAGNFDYILVSLVFDLESYVYKETSSESHFYARKLANIPDNMIERKTTIMDIVNELEFFSKTIPSQSVLLIQMLPEVIFPVLGKDENYKDRVVFNENLKKLSARCHNIHLIDIRKYTMAASDFLDTFVGHYNREIGYAISQEILRDMGMLNEESLKKNSEGIENYKKTKAVVESFSIQQYNFKTCFYICNGSIYFYIQQENSNKWSREEDIKYTYNVFRNRYIEANKETCSNEISMRISNWGDWSIEVEILKKGNHLCRWKSKSIPYYPFTYFNYMSEHVNSYEEYHEKIFKVIEKTYHKNNDVKYILKQISLLAAKGMTIDRFFKKIGIDKLDLFVDMDFGDAIIPFLYTADVEIGHVYTENNYFKYTYDIFFEKTVLIEDINSIEKMKGNNILIAYDYADSEMKNVIFKKKYERVFWIQEVLSSMMTTCFFEKIMHGGPLVAAVRLPVVSRYFSLPYRYITENEKYASLHLNASAILNNASGVSDKKLPKQYDGINPEKLLQTFVIPRCTTLPDGIHVFGDIKSKFLNIENGFRKTLYQPDAYERTIYLFGSSLVFGHGVSDDETISSNIQKIVGDKYRVRNCSNYWRYDEISNALNLLSTIKFKNDDIVVIFFDGLFLPSHHSAKIKRWFNWDAMPDNVLRIDAFPLFMKQNREDYFLLNNALNCKANLEIAELITNRIVNDFVFINNKLLYQYMEFSHVKSIRNIYLKASTNSCNSYQYNILSENSFYAVVIDDVKADFQEYTVGVYDWGIKKFLYQDVFKTSEPCYVNFRVGKNINRITLIIYSGVYCHADGKEMVIGNLTVRIRD